MRARVIIICASFFFYNSCDKWKVLMKGPMKTAYEGGK